MRCMIAVILQVGSLGLHRIGLTEASTLKVREYWARGIPFLLSYEDTDHLETPEMSPFYWCSAIDEQSDSDGTSG